MTFQLQPKHTAPATPTGVGFIHGFELFGPKCIEGTEAMTLKQRTVFSSQKPRARVRLTRTSHTTVMGRTETSTTTAASTGTRITSTSQRGRRSA